MRKFLASLAVVGCSLLIGGTARAACTNVYAPIHSIIPWAPTPYKYSVLVSDRDSYGHHWMLVEYGSGLGYRKWLRDGNIDGWTLTRGRWAFSKYNVNSCGQPVGTPIPIFSILVP